MVKKNQEEYKDLLEEFLHPKKEGGFFPTDEEIREKLSHSKLHELMVQDMNLTDEERVAPDTYGCECIFLHTFVTDKMSDEFSLIAKDFMEHEFSNLDGYEMTDFTDYDSGEDVPETMFQYFMLNLMMNAVNAGSEYARNLFCYLHKTYYKQEYKQLKRFNVLRYEDVRTLADDGSEYRFPFNIARILTMAKMYGIEIATNNSFHYLMLASINKDVMESRKSDPQGIDMDRVRENVERIYAHYTEDEINDLFEKSDWLVDQCLEHWGYSAGYTFDCNDEIFSYDDILGIGLYMLEESFPDKEDFTAEEIFLAMQIYVATGALTISVDRMADRLKEVAYGKRGTDFYDYCVPLFKPEMVGGVLRREKPKKQELKGPTIVNKSDELSEDREKLLMDEITTLRRKLHEQETMIRQLREDMADKGKIMEQLQSAHQKNETNEKELAALRDHVYHLTEDDEAEQSVSVEDMTKALKNKRIVIIGGHTNWVNKLKGIFPKWDYVKPAVSGTQDTSVLMNADKVYFFTDTISHGTYNRYVAVCRDHKVPFGYIHGVNTDVNVRQLYREMAGSQ